LNTLLLGRDLGVSLELGVGDNLADDTLRHKLGNSTTCKGTVDLERLAHVVDSDQLLLWKFSLELLEVTLVEDDHMVLLLTHLSLGPLFLLTLLGGRGSGQQLGCLGLLDLWRLLFEKEVQKNKKKKKKKKKREEKKG
jgi:hypothetical protein